MSLFDTTEFEERDGAQGVDKSGWDKEKNLPRREAHG